MDNCLLCLAGNEQLIWENGLVRVINANEPDYPCYTRVIWQQHVKEMTDLPESQQLAFMRYVFCVESVQRDILKPEKINLAQFGNMVPHLHWHIIPRYKNDRHFPGSTWNPPRFERANAPAQYQAWLANINSQKPTYHQALAQALAQL